MALGKSMSMALSGVLANVVTVEANIGVGLPGFQVVGLADTAITESRDRIRTAVANSKLPWPKTKVVVSMSPASLPKSGSHFDLPVALAVLVAGMKESKDKPQDELGGFTGATGFDEYESTGVDPMVRLERSMVLGELGLDGSIRPVAGVIPALLAARRAGFQNLVIPPGNAEEAGLVPDMNVLVARTLKEAFAWVRGACHLPKAGAVATRSQVRPQPTSLDFRDIAGQKDAKYAAEVAAAGGHHLMMVGPPGAGKSMIAARIPTILPELTTEQCVETTAIHSLTGKPGEVVSVAPFIAPHASVSRAALLGGGSGTPRPGAVSLAHNGVLFLDEASEINAQVLDCLRAPLEDSQVRLVRSRREVTYPARFQLIMAANPCRCAAENAVDCTCKPQVRQNYLRNISGPLWDRLDMVIRVSGHSGLLGAQDEESSATIAQRVQAARERAAHRWAGLGLDAVTNAAVSGAYLRRHCPAEDTAMTLLAAYLASGDLSQRGVDRSLKLSWTLCDLEGGKRPNIDHVSRAIELRGSDVVTVGE